MTIKQIGPDEMQQLVAEGKYDVIDVREPHEWATGHVPGARLVPLGDVRAHPAASVPKDDVIFVCRSGNRSNTAAKIAEDALGHVNLYNLAGGTIGWVKAGLPVVVPEAAPAAPKTQKSADEAAPAEPATPEPTLDALVGQNLKALRTERGLSLDELSRMAGVSRAVLGQVELGKNVPSIGLVWKIAQALGVHFSTLLNTEQRAGTTLLKRTDAKRLLSADGRFSSRALFPFGDPGKVEFYELWLAPHGREDAEPHKPGTRENLIVTAGALDLVVGGEKYRLEQGDAIVFTADVPHSYANPLGVECWMHLVMTYAY